MNGKKLLTLYYRLIQRVMSEDDKNVICHLSSDKCELKFKFNGKTSSSIEIEGGSDKIRKDGSICLAFSYCEYCENEN